MAYRATLKDVAAAAGVSVTTVSLVLNNRPARVSEEKRKAIADAAKKLNYVPNQSARSLVTKQSQLVALIVPDIENLFFAALAKCVEDECAAQGYSLIVANSDDSRVTEHELLQRLPARGVDGVMLIPARESCAGDAAERLREDVALVSCPVVLIDRLTQCGWCDAVGFDNYLGGRLAARYLLEGGHTPTKTESFENIVVTNHLHILSNAQPTFRHTLTETKRHHIIAAEHGRRTAINNLIRSMIATTETVIPLNA